MTLANGGAAGAAPAGLGRGPGADGSGGELAGPGKQMLVLPAQHPLLPAATLLLRARHPHCRLSLKQEAASHGTWAPASSLGWAREMWAHGRCERARVCLASCCSIPACFLLWAGAALGVMYGAELEAEGFGFASVFFSKCRMGLSISLPGSGSLRVPGSP